MKIAVINETSAADKNAHIVEALRCTGHEILNAGMREKGVSPELQYIHTGFLAGLLLNLKRADFIVGGCGTGHGFACSASQYPGVFCGHILSPLDAWLFAQINGGNCVSLALNKGYGWAGDVNLKFIFEKLFSVEFGCGYPAERKAPQRASREMLTRISRDTHRPMAEILESMERDIIGHVVRYPGVAELLNLDAIEDSRVKAVLLSFL